MADKSKKLQTSVEFITTYGFAILIIAIVLGAIYIFTYAPQVVVPTKCTFSPGAYCSDIIVTTNSQGLHALLLITNSQQYPIVNPTLAVNTSEYSEVHGTCEPNYIGPGGVIICNVTFTSNNAVTIGSLIQGSLYLTGVVCTSGNAGACSSQPTQTFAGTFDTHVELASNSTPQILLSAANTTQYPNGVPDQLTAVVDYYGYPLTGATVNFTSNVTFTTISPKIAVSNSNGTSYSYISSTTSGLVNVTASFGTYNDSIIISFSESLPPIQQQPPTTLTISTTSTTTSSTLSITSCGTGCYPMTTIPPTTYTPTGLVYCYLFSYESPGENTPTYPIGCYDSNGDVISATTLQSEWHGFSLYSVRFACAGIPNSKWYDPVDIYGPGTCPPNQFFLTSKYAGTDTIGQALAQADNLPVGNWGGYTNGDTWLWYSGSLSKSYFIYLKDYTSGVTNFPWGPSSAQGPQYPVPPDELATGSISTSSGYIELQYNNEGADNGFALWFTEVFSNSAPGQPGYLGPICGDENWSTYASFYFANQPAPYSTPGAGYKGRSGSIAGVDQGASGCSSYVPLFNSTDVSINVPESDVPAGQHETLTAEVVGGTPPYTYYWTVDGLGVSTSSTLTFSALNWTTGPHNVQVFVTDASWQTGNATAVVGVGTYTTTSSSTTTSTSTSTSKASSKTIITIPSSSFIQGTQVLMSDGVYEPIQSIQPGQTVLSYDTQTSKFYSNTVLKVINFTVSGEYVINNVIGTDSGEVFYTSNGTWTHSNDLQVGDEILNPLNDTWISVTNITYTPGTIKVYDLIESSGNDFIVDGGYLADIITPD